MTRPVVAALSLFLSFAPADTGHAGWRPQLMERSQEIAAALESCPEILRDGAGVYVLGSEGYELARVSENGFHSIVGRSQADSFEPQCLDAEGSATHLQRILLRGRLVMSGLSPEEVDRQVSKAWARGEVRAPRRPGINYMLSTRNRVPVGPDRVIPYQPHLMFYVPYLTNQDVGGDMTGAASPIFVINEGSPSAYVIVPLGDPMPTQG